MAGVLAPPGALVVIEQPELHLHPSAQARLGDFFIAMAHRGVRFLIETHSENLIIRLRRRIAETTAGTPSLGRRFLLNLDELRKAWHDV